MPRCILVLMILASAVFSQSQLKVLSYNIMGMKPGSYPEHRLNIIILYLKALDPDIIGLQEINEDPKTGLLSNQARLISDSLSAHFGRVYHYYCQQTHMAWDSQFSEMVAIISKHPVYQQGYHPLPKGAFPRKVLWNQILTPLGMVNFFNTHLDGEGTGAASLQVQQLMDYVADRDAQFPAKATIITGDFNNIPGSDPIQQMAANSYLDTWPLLHPLLPGYTVPIDAPNAKIDYVFYKSAELKPDSARVVLNERFRGTWPSDHCGVMTVFSVHPAEVQTANKVVESFDLAQNYPNPFNARTRINYHLMNRGPVTLRVYDVTSAEVVTLVHEIQGAGEHTTVFDASGCAAGLYFYRLVTESGVLTKKMLAIN